MAAQLHDESGLGVLAFSWTSRNGSRCEVQWAEGMSLPLAFRRGLAAEIRNPERFGFTQPVTVRNFRAFAQRFADAFEDLVL